MASDSKVKQLPPIAPGPGPLREIRPLIKNRKSSIACLPCKQTKRKCTGQPPPCKTCQSTGSYCSFDATQDLRRKVAAKKTADEMEFHRATLSSLLQLLRMANNEKLQQTQKTIRESPPDPNRVDMTYIAASIEALLIEESPSGTPTMGISDMTSEYPRSMASGDKNTRITVDKLCDNPLFRVPCKAWTKVTEDNHLVSHLVSVYFTWHHPLMQIVDQQMFLRDMCAESTSSEFCSPVLVNSILAVASIYSDYPEIYAVRGDRASRGQQFFNEAEMLWKEQEGRPSLANIQALALLSHNLKFQGKDNASWLYLRQAVQLGQDLGMFTLPRVRHHGWEQMPEDVNRAAARTAWGIFILNSQESLEYRKPTNLELPRENLDKTDDLERDSLWIPYPRLNHEEYPQKPARLLYVMTGLAHLARTMVDIQDLFFNKASDMSVNDIRAEADRLHTRLERFLDSLPNVANPDSQPIPQVLFLYIKCYHLVDSLLGFLLEERELGSSLGSSIAERIKLRKIHAAKQVAQHLRLYRQYYGLDQTPSLMFEPAISSALTLVTLLHDDDEESFDILSELYEFLESSSRRFPGAKGAIYKIDSLAHNLNITLPFDNTAMTGNFRHSGSA
ncbi:hypothetical protein BDV12DRAFT_186259 [Aspergillus spectabilis]